MHKLRTKLAWILIRLGFKVMPSRSAGSFGAAQDSPTIKELPSMEAATPRIRKGYERFN